QAPRRVLSIALGKKAPALAFVVVAVACISASDPPAVETLLRAADEAYASENYEAALGLYEKAETLTRDPGRISFKKGAAYCRLERYREAVECYRRALEDDSSPAERRARGCFDLGNALVQQGSDSPHQLTEAIKAYRAAISFATPQTKWMCDARHNLELAQLL